MNTFPEIEGRQLEFKEQLTNYKRFCETVVAFSNDIGGRILIGVRNEDRELTGVSEEQIDRLIEDLPKVIFDSITPYCRPLIQTLNINNKNLIEVRVFPGERKPYFIKSKGFPEGVYFRIGSHNRKATPEIVEDLKRQAHAKHFDLEYLPKSEISDFDQDLLVQIYGERMPNTQRLLTDHALGLDAISLALTTTVAGHVYFNKKPNIIFPQAEILLSQFAGVDNSQLLKTIDLSAPLPLLADQALTIILDWVGYNLELSSSRKIPKNHEIPRDGLREAIVNALIHRKYFLPDAVKIAVYADRVEIYSPGNFPGLIGDLRSGMSYPRNPHLRQIARKHNLVEKRGLGLNLIFDSCLKNGNLEPKVLELDDAVKVILYRSKKAKVDNFPEYAEPLLKFYQSKQSLSTSEATTALEVSANTARKILIRLADAGFLQIKGSGRGTKYVWK